MDVTTKIIAEEAGVSMTTVTNVLNNRVDRVSEKTMNKVKRVIEKYQYVPNMNARSLASSTSNLVGLLYYSEDEQINFSNPFVSEVLEGIEKVLKEDGYFVLVHNIMNVAEIKNIQRNWKFSGFIIVGSHTKTAKEIDNIVNSNVPVVFIDNHLESDSELEKFKNSSFVATDDMTASETITNYLIDNHHKNIAFLSYPFSKKYPNVIDQRFLGYQKALREKDLKFDSRLVFESIRIEECFSFIKEYTAIVISSDILAMQFMHEMKNRDISQETISIVGFDDVAYSRYVNPPLTTMRLNNRDKGKLAAMKLLAMKEETYTASITYVPSELIVRESVFMI